MSDEGGFSIILEFGDLQAKLQTINDGPHQWIAKLVRDKPAEKGWTKFYAEVWYSNPGPKGMPNELGFRFPAFPVPIGDVMECLVCVHPSVMVPIQEGLYFDGDRLLRDPLEDFENVWRPMRKMLS